MSSLRLPYMQPRPAYDPLTDFTWIMQLTGSLLGIVLRSGAPWQTLQDLVAYAKANPGKVTYGTLGIGSTEHMAMEKIGRAAGIDWTHVPYRGTADTLTALIGGHIDVAADSSAWAPMVQDGSMRLLATFGYRRPKRFDQANLYLDSAAWQAAARRYIAEERELLRQTGLLAQPGG